MTTDELLRELLKVCPSGVINESFNGEIIFSTGLYSPKYTYSDKLQYYAPCPNCNVEYSTDCKECDGEAEILIDYPN